MGVEEAHPFVSEIGITDFAIRCLRQPAGKCSSFSGLRRRLLMSVPGFLGDALKNHVENPC